MVFGGLMDLTKFNIHPDETDPAASIIARRRGQLLVHAILYYKCGTSMVTDTQWDIWAYDLVDLYRAFPDKIDEGPYAKDFLGWDGSTGFHLPLEDKPASKIALRILAYGR